MDKKTLEELSNVHKIKDMWDSFNDEEGNNSSKIMNFDDGIRYKIRFVGPFHKARRIYVQPLSHIQQIPPEEFKKIISGNSEIADPIIKRLHEIAEENNAKIPQRRRSVNTFDLTQNNRGDRGRMDMNPVPIIDTDAFTALNTIMRMKDHSHWQRCVLVNAFVESSTYNSMLELKVIPLTETMLSDLRNITSISNSNISGLNAHDITISRNGHGLETQWRAKLSKKPSFLKTPEIERLLREGLLDIAKLVREKNNKSLAIQSSYFYKMVSQPKLSIEMAPILFKELMRWEANMSAENADNNIDNLPDEAFENKDAMSDPINCLEI